MLEILKSSSEDAKAIHAILKAQEVHCCFCNLHALAQVDGKPYCSACIEVMLDAEQVSLSDIRPLEHVEEQI